MAAPAACRRGAAALLVEIETDERDRSGSARPGSAAASRATVIEKVLQPMLIGEDPLLIEGLWQKMFARTRQYGRRGIVMNAISGIDIALWDIAGKVANLPLYRLLGGCRDRVEAYASGGFYQEGQVGRRSRRRGRGLPRPRLQGHEDEDRAQSLDPDPSAPTGRPCRALRGRPEEDIARVAAVRRALGPQAKLMVDVNCAWSPAFAIEMGRALEPYKLYWIEEPVATDDIDGSARVADALATPIAGYETEIGLYGFRELITRGAVDIVQPDIAWAGGFSECRRIAALAQAHHLMVAPHAFASAVTAGRLAAFHRLDPERAGARIGPEPQRAARRAAEGADRASRPTARSGCRSGPASASSSIAARSRVSGGVG